MDIHYIYEYISQRSMLYANKTAMEIYKSIYDLKYSPYIGRYIPESKNREYREIIYKHYRIIYSIFEDLEVLFVHTVIHDKRDLNQIRNLNL